MCCSHKCGALSADSERYRSHVKWLHISCLDWIWNQMHMSCHDNEPGVLSPGPAFEVTESFTQPSDILRHISYSPLFLSLMCVVCVTSVSNLTNENSIRKYLHTKRLKASHIRMQTATYKKKCSKHISTSVAFLSLLFLHNEIVCCCALTYLNWTHTHIRHSDSVSSADNWSIIPFGSRHLQVDTASRCTQNWSMHKIPIIYLSSQLAFIINSACIFFVSFRFCCCSWLFICLQYGQRTLLSKLWLSHHVHFIRH